ncbi:MAG: hypothetical protein IJM17_01435 [Firmicutes bacterium]|nr:hypothetical protein [Bacillota bacterium]
MLDVILENGKLIMLALLCLPVLVICVKGLADLGRYNRALKNKAMEKELLREARLKEQKREEERRRRFEAQYSSMRGGKR